MYLQEVHNVECLILCNFKDSHYFFTTATRALVRGCCLCLRVVMESGFPSVASSNHV
jgi:hypothetical protein